MSLKRALSAEDITENRQGMIAKLLKTQDPEELEALGLTVRKVAMFGNSTKLKRK